MTTNPNPIDVIIVDGVAVSKADVRSHEKTRVAQVMADATEVRNTNLAGQLVINVKALKEDFYLDTSDTTTSDDGLTCIISFDGGRYKPGKLLPVGNIVGTSDVQTLTHKTINGPDNTITNLAASSLAAVAAATLMGNPTAAGAAVIDFTMPSLNVLAAPHQTSDLLLGYDHTAQTFVGIHPKSIAGQLAVDTIAALRTLDKTSQPRVVVNGYYAAGDCRPRLYVYDAADTTSSDNGGTIIVATDGGRWKVSGGVTGKMFGARANGSDDSAFITAGLQWAAANGVPFEFDGNFSVTHVTLAGANGLHIIGRGGLIGIASSATDSIFEFQNCTDVTINGRLTINGSYNTNYTYGIHFYTTGGGQAISFIDLTNLIIVGCKWAYGWGQLSRPDDLISEIQVRGGYTYGCPGIIRAFGAQTVVNYTGAVLFSGTSGGNPTWQALATLGIDAVGACVNLTGCEVLSPATTANSLFRTSAIASSGLGNIYGAIMVTNCLIECANALAVTNANSLTTPILGSLTFVGCNFVHTQDTQDLVQADSAYAGRIVFTGNYGHASVSRSHYNISAANTACQIVVDVESFGSNFLQGYLGLSGGNQYVIGSDALAWTSYTPTVTAQAGTITTVGSATGRFMRRGKTILAEVDVQITTVGSAVQGAVVTLPFTARSNNYIGTSYEYGLTGKSGAATIIPSVSGTGSMVLRDSTGTTYFASGAKFTGQVEYEIP